MKKSKLVALALAAGITLMGAGYAGWTDNFTSENVVETGNLDVNFVDGDNYADVWIQENNQWKRVDDKFGKYNLKCTATPNEEEKSINFKFSKLFPGVHAKSQFTLSNDGTVPTKIQAVRLGLTGATDENKQLYDALTVDGIFCIYNGDTLEKEINLSDDGNPVKLNDLQAALTKTLKGAELQAGRRLCCKKGSDGTEYLNFRIEGDALNGDEGENQAVTITLDFDFVQSNLYNPD